MLDGQAPLFYPQIPTSLSPPSLLDVVNFQLGTVHGVELTFTGSAPASVSFNRILEATEFIYIAGAEASPDATRDGVVVGTAMGLVMLSQRPTLLLFGAIVAGASVFSVARLILLKRLIDLR